MSSNELKLTSICAYLTDVTNPWRGEDHTASKMVKALKGDKINGYFTHEIKGKNHRFGQSNIQEFIDRIPPALARLILRDVHTAATLVPIPNSHVTAIDTPNFRTLDLANSVAAESKGLLTVVPALVFVEPQQKSRDGGPRSPAHFESVYRITSDIKGPIVLIDDVCTSGSHLIGACWKLSSPTRQVVLGAAFGRSTKTQITPTIGVREEILDIRRPPTTFAERVRRALEKKN